MKNYNKLLEGLRNTETRNSNFLHLTAYENQISRTAGQFLASDLSGRYFFGAGENSIIDWNPFTCLGLPAVEEIISEASAKSCINVER